jgi:prepilin-type N-terminal cleavage/methylation domain-containing protein
MNKRVCRGFTLVEVSIASALMVVLLALAMRGFIHVLSGTSQARIQNELDIDVQKSMERIKADLRLTSLNEIYLSPAAGTLHKAISFPMAEDRDGDGMVDTNPDGSIDWARTVIYHVWDGYPNQLRITTFNPRDNTLTPVERQTQVDAVLASGSGAGAPNGHNATTEIVFENLFDWNVTPSGPLFDGYAAEPIRNQNVNLGSCVLTPGTHQVTFKVVDKNALSSSYGIGVDSLYASTSYSVREGEAQLPAVSSSLATPVRQFMPGGSWSGNHQLYFPATAKNAEFTLAIDNDRWEETNFDAMGTLHERTEVLFNSSLSPSDFVVQLRGMDTNWLAADQTANLTGSNCSYDQVNGCAVRVLISGAEMINGGWTRFDGQRTRVNFRAGAAPGQGLVVWAASIAESASSSNVTMNAKSGTWVDLRFSGVDAYAIINPGMNMWSDYAVFPVQRDRSYVVSYLMTTLVGWGNAWKWDHANPSNTPTCFIIPSSSSPGYADMVADVWSSPARADVISTNSIFGVEALYTTYPTNGVFTSQPFDTQMDAPAYARLDWSLSLPGSSLLSMKVRTATTNDMSDAPAWSSVASFAPPAAISPPSRRYIQFQAQLTAGSAYQYTPILRDVLIAWPGDTRAVDVGGTFTKAPSYGVFQVYVDGSPLKAGVKVELEIFRDARGFGGVRTLTSALTAEVQPLNTW